MKKSYFKHLFILIVSIFIIVGCGGGNSGGEFVGSNGNKAQDNSYELDNKTNHAIMGPLEGANVNVYTLNDINKSIETTKTGKLGSFSLKLKGIDDNELLLVAISGGKDVDANDDGILDKVPTVNKGTIHGFATAKDLREGKVNVTLLSEIIYQYVNDKIRLIGRDITKDDFKKLMETVSISFFKNERDISKINKKSISFNPLLDKKLLSINYNSLIAKNGLSDLYHNGKSIESIRNKIYSLFYSLPISLNDARLLNIKDNFKISFTANHIDYNVTGADFSKKPIFVKKDSNITIRVNDIDDGYKILNWNGCDYVSNDLKSCNIYQINSDKQISVIVVPEIKVKTGVTIRDISNAYVDIDKNSSTKTDMNLTAYSDISDKNTSDILGSIAVDDIIVHKTNPVFFAKVSSVNKINDFRYQIMAKEVPIDEILESGYIATKTNKIGYINNGTSTRVISRSLILPNGKIVEFDPNKPAKIKLTFAKYKNKLYRDEEKKYPYIDDIKEIDGGYEATIELSEDAKLTGSITIKPIFDFDMSWGFFSGLEQIHLSNGVAIDDNINIDISKEWSYDKKLTIKNFIFTQVIMVGPLPVVLDEPIEIYVGFNGKVSAAGNLGLNSSVSPTLVLDWSKDNGASINLEINPVSELKAKISGEEDAFAYLGIYPSFQVYGIGGGIDNKLGLYTNASGEVSSDNTISLDGENLEIKAGLKGEYGVKYEGTIGFNSTWDKVDDVMKEINKKLPNEGKFDKKWILGKFDINNESFKKPGNIVVVGKKNIEIADKLDDFSSYFKQYDLKLKNNGEKNISYRVEIYNPYNKEFSYSLEASSSIKPKIIKCGTIKPNKDISINSYLTSAVVDKIGTYHMNLKVYQSDKEFLCNKLDHILNTKAFLLPKFISNINISVNPNDLDKLEKTNMKVDIKGTTIKKLSFTWDKKDSYKQLNGYKIYISDYNTTDKNCNSLVKLFAISYNNNYSEDLLSLQKKDLIKVNKPYCFYLTGYKKYDTISGKSLLYEQNLLDKPIITTPLKSVLDENTTDDNTTLATAELDVMFLVDMTGSYYDDLDTFKNKSKNIVEALKDKLPKGVVLKVGVSSFEDYGNTKYDGDSSDTPYTLEQNLTTDTNKFIDAINNKLELGSGGDGPEAQLEGLYQTITDPKVGWNNSAMKLIILFTDANFHDSDRDSDYPGHGSLEVKQLLKTNNISVIGMGSGEISSDLDNISNWTFLLNSDSSGVVEKINSLIEAIPGTKITRDIEYKRIRPNLYFVSPSN